MSAQVGDDVFHDDPTINSLEEFAAARFEKEAALFLVSGTQSNLAALMAHCERGDEYIVSSDAHTYKYEGGGAAVLASIQPQPIEPNDDGTMSLDKIRAALKPDDSHFARSRCLTFENTTGGRVLPQSYLQEATALGRELGLSLHLDGARLFNAAAAQSIDANEIAAPFDSVSVCLSKGLGAPVGSVLVGSKVLVDRARRWRKVLGGGCRQAGFLAAAGRYALEHHTTRLLDDHRRAAALAEGLKTIDGVQVDGVATNMVFVTPPKDTLLALEQFLETRDIKIYVRGDSLRLVLHLDVDDSGVAAVVDAFDTFYGER